MEDSITNSWYCTFVLNLSIFSVGLSVTFGLTCLNPLVPVIQRIYNQTYLDRYGEPIPDETWTTLLSLTMSMLLAGAFLASLMFKAVLGALTRKQIMILTHICNVTGYAIVAIGVGIWGSYEAFIVGRFVTGLCLGFGLSVVSLVANETCVSHRQQFYGGVLGTSFPCGSVIAVIIAWPKVLGTDDLWIFVMIFGMLYSLVYLACAYWITDTPFQTMIRHGGSETMEVLRKLRQGDESGIEAELQDLQMANAGKEAIATFTVVFLTPQYRRHFIAAVTLFSYVMLAGLNNILFYSDTIFLNAGLDQDIVTPATLGVLVLGPIFSVVGIVAMNKGAEPRTMLLVGGVIAVIGDAFLTACVETYERVPAMSIAAIAAMCIYYIGFSFVNLLAYVIIGAITTDKTRPVCANIGSAALWFCAWIVGFLSAYFQVWIGGYAFLVWMGFTIAISVYIVFFVPNTGGKTSDEIQNFFKDKNDKPMERYTEL